MSRQAPPPAASAPLRFLGVTVNFQILQSIPSLPPCCVFVSFRRFLPLYEPCVTRLPQVTHFRPYCKFCHFSPFVLYLAHAKLSNIYSYLLNDFILESVKKLEKLFIAPKARQILHETAHRALARCECAQHMGFLMKYFHQESVSKENEGHAVCLEFFVILDTMRDNPCFFRAGS